MEQLCRVKTCVRLCGLFQADLGCILSWGNYEAFRMYCVAGCLGEGTGFQGRPAVRAAVEGSPRF